MTIVVLGIDALDPELVDSSDHTHLSLACSASINTISSSTGEPSTHELWPTIITGLPPEEHGLTLDDGIAWENPLLAQGSRLADLVVPENLQTRIGAWLLNNTGQDAFRIPATYYAENGIDTLFDGRTAKAIGVPNYVTGLEKEDREHQLRRSIGDLFERDPDAKTGHRSADPAAFYEQCMEMGMIRIARTRRALRSCSFELVFGYTSGLDLIGHVAHRIPELQSRAYDELDDFVGELKEDLRDSDDLLLVSDHGLQDGLHTESAMVAATDPEIIEGVESVLDVRGAVESALAEGNHKPDPQPMVTEGPDESVRDHLEELGYM